MTHLHRLSRAWRTYILLILYTGIDRRGLASWDFFDCSSNMPSGIPSPVDRHVLQHTTQVSVGYDYTPLAPLMPFSLIARMQHIDLRGDRTPLLRSLAGPYMYIPCVCVCLSLCLGGEREKRGSRDCHISTVG